MGTKLCDIWVCLGSSRFNTTLACMDIWAERHYAEARPRFKQTLIKDASQHFGVLGRTDTCKGE